MYVCHNSMYSCVQQLYVFVCATTLCICVCNNYMYYCDNSIYSSYVIYLLYLHQVVSSVLTGLFFFVSGD